MSTQRTREWFDDDELWRLTYPFLFTEARFEAAQGEMERVIELTQPPGQAALDLCCGPGRSSLALARLGYAVTGVDRTPGYLEEARQRAAAEGLEIEWVHMDMRDFEREGAFDLALSMFTSFGYFDDKAEDIQVLEHLHASLKPSGVCLIDVMGKERLARIFSPSSVETLPDGTRLVQCREIFDDWSRIRNEWIVLKDGRARGFEFHHTVYSGQELKALLRRAGFTEVKLYGDLDGAPYGPEATRLIAVGRKA